MTRVERWERRVEVPLLLLALAFLVAYAWPVLDPRLDGDVRSVLTGLSWAVWAAFVVDFVVRVSLANDRRSYVVRHWYDVPLIVLPMLRPLRVLRLLAFARMLNRSATAGLIERAAVYVGGAVVMSVGLGAIAVLDAERSAPRANITSFGDALWWASTTVTTVGYGDRYPVTTEGRLIAVALMVVGIGLVGAVTASVATWMVSKVQREQRAREMNNAHSKNDWEMSARWVTPAPATPQATTPQPRPIRRARARPDDAALPAGGDLAPLKDSPGSRPCSSLTQQC